MSWVNARMNVDGVTYLGHRQGMIFTIPCTSALELGDTFGADGQTFKVEAIMDLNQRGEVFVIDAKEVKNDKPKARGTKPITGGENVSLSDQHGHDDAD